MTSAYLEFCHIHSVGNQEIHIATYTLAKKSPIHKKYRIQFLLTSRKDLLIKSYVFERTCVTLCMSEKELIVISSHISEKYVHLESIQCEGGCKSEIHECC